MLTIKGPERHSAAESLLTSKFESPLSTHSLRRAAYNKNLPRRPYSCGAQAAVRFLRKCVHHGSL